MTSAKPSRGAVWLMLFGFAGMLLGNYVLFYAIYQNTLLGDALGVREVKSDTISEPNGCGVFSVKQFDSSVRICRVGCAAFRCR